MTEMGGYPCTSEDSYGYHEATPCVLVKLNKVGVELLSDFWKLVECYISRCVFLFQFNHTKKSFQVFGWEPDLWESMAGEKEEAAKFHQSDCM